MKPLTGQTFRGRVSVAGLERAILKAAEAHGLRVSSRSEEGGQVALSLIQEAPPAALLRRRVPHRMEWRLHYEGDETTVTCAPRMFRWFQALAWITSFVWPLLFLIGFEVGPFRGLELTPFEVGLILLIGLGMLYTPVYLRIDLHGDGLTRFWERLFEAADSEGAYLSTRQRIGRGPNIKWGLGYVGCVLLVIGTIVGSEFSSFVADMPLLLVPLLIAMASFIAALVVLVFSPSLGLRARSLLAGMRVLLGMIFLLCTPLPWLIGGVEFEGENMTLLTEIVSVHSGRAPSMEVSAEVAAKVALKIDEFIGMVIVCVGGSCLFAVLATILIIGATQVALKTLPSLSRLRVHAREDPVREAISAHGLLSSFRAVFVVPWFVLALAVIPLLLTNTVCAYQALGGAVDLPEILDVGETVRFSVLCGLLLLGLPPDHATGALVVKSLWVALAVVCWAPILASLAQYAVSSRRRRARLMQLSMLGGKRKEALVACLRGVASRMRMSPPALALLPESGVNAKAVSFGWPRGTRIVIVNEGAVRRLGIDSPLMEALLAHELSHFALGHVGTFRLLRFLARLTLVGDTFAAAMIDSFACEWRADQLACSRGGTTHTRMRACLHVLEIEGLRRDGGAASSVSSADDAMSSVGGGAYPDQRSALGAFLHLYTTPYSYWHPHLRERIEMLT